MSAARTDRLVGGERRISHLSDAFRMAAGLKPVSPATGPAPGQPHPIFGRMSEAAWLRWGDVHTDHHLRRFGA